MIDTGWIKYKKSILSTVKGHLHSFLLKHLYIYWTISLNIFEQYVGLKALTTTTAINLLYGIW